MQGKKKIYSPGQTYFVALRERTYTTGFYDNACCEFYLLRLLNGLNIYHVKLHAYLFKPKEIWLLATPGTPDGFDSLLRFLNQRYSSYFNTRFGRSVKVWSDSPITCLVSGGNLVLDCQKFIEREALREEYVSHPGEYLWSSYCDNSFSLSNRYLTPHRAYKKFLQGKPDCFEQYRKFIVTPYPQAYYLYLKSRLLSGTPLQKMRGNSPARYNKAMPAAQNKSRFFLSRQ